MKAGRGILLCRINMSLLNCKLFSFLSFQCLDFDLSYNIEIILGCEGYCRINKFSSLTLNCPRVISSHILFFGLSYKIGNILFRYNLDNNNLYSASSTVMLK